MTPDRDAFGNEIGASAPSVGAPPVRAPMPPPPTPAPPPAPAPPVTGLPPVPAPPPVTAPPPPMPSYGMAPTAPGAVGALVLGILGLWLAFLAPFAWVRGNRVLREIDASMGRLGGRGLATAARVLGIVGTCLLAFWVLAIVVAALAGSGGSTTTIP